MFSLFSSRPTVWFRQECLDNIAALATESAPEETGGLLLGYWRADGETAVVTEVVGPGPGASHARHEFEPDTDYHAAEVQRIYVSSGRIISYLGDWHTHPASSTSLSRLDRRTMKRVADDPAARASQPLMGVLAGGEPWTLKIWVYHGLLKTLSRPRAPIAARVQTYTEDDTF